MNFVCLASFQLLLLLCPEILLSRIASAIPTLSCYAVCYVNEANGAAVCSNTDKNEQHYAEPLHRSATSAQQR